ncbi:MAG: hypothetical protein PUD26_03980 [bacterium]|nr:hypothetical protein [bacterium]
MGLFNGLKRALGLSDDYEEEDDLEGMDSNYRTPYVNPFKKGDDTVTDLSSLAPREEASMVVNEPQPVAEVEEKLPDGVFDGIITIINGNLPEFVRDCIDIEKERKAVYVAMGPQFRDYVRNLRRSSLDEARQQWVDERTRLTSKISQTELRAEEAVKKANEIKDRLMSEERQRRAIVERSHDLEARIADLEAQHEQDQLQNKGLLNKVKVMQLKADEAQKDAEEITRLSALVNEQRRQLMEANDAEVRMAELSTENENLRADIEELKQKADTTAIEDEYKSKMEVTNALINQLRTAATQKEQEVMALTEKFRLANEEIENLQNELAEAHKDLEIAAEVQETIEQFEEYKIKKAAEVESLKAQLASAQTADNEAVEAQKKQVADIRLENNRLLMRITELEMKLQSARNDGEAKLKELQSQYEASKAGEKGEIEALTDKLKDAQTQRVAMQNKLAAAEVTIAELRESNNSRSVSLANQIDSLKTQLKKAVERMEAAEAKVDSMTEAQAKTNAELKTLKADNMAMKVHERNLKDNIADRDREIAELRKSLAEGGVALPNEVGSDAEVVLNVDNAAVSAIDDIDDIDWLMPSPPSEPEPEPAPEPVVKEEKHKSNSDIGDAQMSLF